MNLPKQKKQIHQNFRKCLKRTADMARRIFPAFAITALLFSIIIPNPASAVILFQNDDFATIESSSLIINSDNGSSSSLTLQFGQSLNETLTWNSGTSQFDLSDDLNITGNLTVSGVSAGAEYALTGDIADTLAGDVNNYAPTGIATATVLRLTATTSTRTITGLTGGADGRILLIHNVGGQDIVLADENASSTAANRFALAANATLKPDAMVQLQYDSTATRWRFMGLFGLAAGGDLTGTYPNPTVTTNAITFAKMQDITSDRLIGRDTASSGDPEEISLANSIVFTGSSSIQLSGDAASPGNSQYYGTNGSGTKGWFALPSGGGYATIQDEASGLTQRTTLNFTGAGVSCVDNAGSTRTDCTISGGGGSTPTGTGFRHVTSGSEDAAAKLVETADVSNDQITNALLANMAQATLKGRAAGAGAGDPTDLTPAEALAAIGAFSTVNIQTFTTPGAATYTPTSGMKYVLVFVTGGGGGGGGADATAATDVGVGGGGGAGGTGIRFFSAATVGASKSLNIGSAGAAGSATNGTNGGTGGNSTWNSTDIVGNGGVGGTGSGTTAKNVQIIAGGAGGTATGGTFNITGGAGHGGSALLTLDATDTNEVAFAIGGQGAASYWGGGGRNGATAQDAAAADSTAGSQAGSAGLAYGAGGGGGAVLNTATGVAGGAGMSGAIVVIEFL